MKNTRVSVVVYLVLLFICFWAKPGRSHPWCVSDTDPTIPDPPLENCKAYNKYPGSCCDAEREYGEVWYPRGRYVAGRDSASLTCRKILSNLLCAVCNPLEGHIFGSETGSASTKPSLCMPFCERFYNTCANVSINTNARVYVPFRIPGLNAGNGTVLLRELYPTVSSYCSKYGSTDSGACHTDNPSEPIITVPPTSPTRTIRLVQLYPNVPFMSIPIQGLEKGAKRHITDVQWVPGTNRVIVAYQSGQIFTFVDSPTANSYEMVVDLKSIVYFNDPSETGLMGLTFDPNFVNNRYFYVKYNKAMFSGSLNNIVLSRLQMRPDELKTDLSTERVIFDIPRPGTQHHSGTPVFTNEGLMYIPIGDGINCCKEKLLDHPSRNLSQLVGKILRIDLRASAAKANNASGPLYTIPSDNPFVNKIGALGEIWAYGLRNPYKLTWDDRTGEFWLADVGEQHWEEVNIVYKGKDYGWNLREGNSCWARSNCSLYLDENYVPPVFVHPHTAVCGSATCLPANALIGGVWYNGDSVTLLKNKYIYADWTGGHIYVLSLPDRSRPMQNVNVTELAKDFNPPITTEFHPSLIAKDRTGEIIIANWWDPQIWKITEE